MESYFLFQLLIFYNSDNNREHAYSHGTTHPQQQSHQPEGILTSPNGKSVEPLVQLKETTREFLDNLMMEGDLLEVSLDETNHLWRLLVAAKPTMSDLSYIYTKYNITVSVQGKKNHNFE